jgi:Coenzyme PQQ synthesis protein D (PqqD)
MNPAVAFRLAGPHVVAEEIEGEVIAVNLDTGAYFSFRDSASFICQRLLAGEGRPARIVDELCARFAGTREEVVGAVLAFLQRIEAEGLIAPIEAPRPDPGGPDRTPDGAERAPFNPPVYEKYTDMEEFLLVDPIHEVDVSDWPAVEPRERT